MQITRAQATKRGIDKWLKKEKRLILFGVEVWIEGQR